MFPVSLSGIECLSITRIFIFITSHESGNGPDFIHVFYTIVYHQFSPRIK